jgi:hypothetical protein
MPNAQLNVLFHGLFVFYDKPDEIEVLIPDMGDDHVYRAGEWLGELELPRSKDPYVLSGVSGDGGTFTPAMNLIVADAPPSNGDDGVYARIQVPRPNKITSLRQVQLRADCVTGPDKDLIAPSTISAEQVFTYDIDDGDPTNVKLGDHYMTNSAQQFGNDFFMNLHILAEPDHLVRPQHPVDGFDMAISLIPTLSGNVELACSPKIPPLTDPALLPHGCILEEFLDLSRREERLAFYSRRIREVLGAHPSAAIPPWTDLAGISDDIHNCLSFITTKRP